MIQINLLGESTAIDHTAKFIVAGYVASVALCCVVFLSLYSSVTADVKDLTLKSDELQAQLETLKTKTQAVRDLEKKQNTLKRKIALIAKLKKSKAGPVRVLDDLNVALPRRVWLRQMLEEKGIMKIRGRALNNQDIAMFMKNLSTSDYFEDVDLVESRQMYYSKRTGMVTPTPDVDEFRTADFGKDQKASKEVSGGPNALDTRGQQRQALLKQDMKSRAFSRQTGAQDSRGSMWNRSEQFGSRGSVAMSGTNPTRAAEIEDRNVKIKEFIVSAKLRYAGKFGSAFDDLATEEVQPVALRK